MKLSRLLAISFVVVLCCAVLTQAQSDLGFENCTGHQVPPSSPWYRPSGSSAVCIGDGRVHSGVYAVMAAPNTAYGPVCQDVALDAGTVDVGLWCRANIDELRSCVVELRAEGGEGGYIDKAITGFCSPSSQDGYNYHAVYLTVPTTDTFALCFGNGAGVGDAQVLIDDVEISISGTPMPTHTPEPVTPTPSLTPTPTTPTPTPTPVSDYDIPPIGGPVTLSPGMLDATSVTLGTIGVVSIVLTFCTFLSKVVKRVFSR